MDPNALTTHGPLGIAVLALAGLVGFLVRRNDARGDEHAAAMAKASADHATRMGEIYADAAKELARVNEERVKEATELADFAREMAAGARDITAGAVVLAERRTSRPKP